MELKDVKGLGKARLELLSEKGINTTVDLLNVFPSKYLNFTDIDAFLGQIEGTQLTLKCTMVSEAKSVYFKGLNYTISKFVCLTSGRPFNAVWYGQPYMKNNLKINGNYYLIGKINKKKQLTVTNWFEIDKLENKIVPIYGSSIGLTKTVAINSIKEILKNEEELSFIDSLKDAPSLRIKDAYNEIHFPTEIEKLEEAKKRVALEDLVLLASLEDEISSTKEKKQRTYPSQVLAEFKKHCPYKLTLDQEKVVNEILNDLKSDLPMNRLLIGDVGSGKTLVAFFSVFATVMAGHSAIMLCPTEILAKQHYESFCNLFNNANVKVEQYYSSLQSSEKKEIEKKALNGKVDFIIATHSALNEKLVMPNLGLVITDEQHRFGVEQRAKLALKGKGVDNLIMSATPIPRSLALVLFGGLKVSELTSRPHGESKIQTKIVCKDKEESMWNYIGEEIKNNNGRCFVIANRITEGNEEEGLYSVEDVYKKITKKYGFKADRVAIVHGKIDKEETDSIISLFKNGNIDILISTTIIEVGIDVKEANLMVIYNPERFGLATLHQLRGRIGRDGREGFCFLCVENISEQSAQRLKLFKNNNSGLSLAEEDLKLRGAGTLYGTKQHGANELFLHINFSLEEYKKAKKLYNNLDEKLKMKTKENAIQKFGDIYKKIVLN